MEKFSENRSSKLLRKPILHIMLITVVGLIVYSNTFKVPFVLDDHYVIANNPIIKDLNYFIKPSTAQHFDKNLFEYPTFKKRYIGYLTFAMNYKIHGLDVTGYHIVNLLIHISTALLIYYFIILSFRTPYMQSSSLKERSEYIAVIAALFFVAHPIQTQAVTYIWQRIASLASMFYLLSVIMYVKARLTYQNRSEENAAPIRGRAARSLSYYLASAVSAVFAMKTKEMAFTLPVSIALYEFMFFGGNFKRRALYVIPLFCTMLIIPLSLINIDRPFGELISSVGEVTRLQTDMSRFDYLFTEFRVIMTYIRLLFLPINQNLLYEYQIYRSFIDPNVFLSLIFLLALFGGCVFLLYRYRNKMAEVRLLSYGIFWFFITLSVESGMIPIMDPIFEHRMYLPSIGIFASFITVVFLLVTRLQSKWRNAEKLSVAVLAVLLVVLSGTTYARNEVWRNEVKLWEDVVRKSPNQGIAHAYLGFAYDSKGLHEKAIYEFKIAISNYEKVDNPINSKDKLVKQYHMGQIYQVLGNAYARQNFFDEAITAYKNSLLLRPDDADVYNNLGSAYARLNLFEEAISAYKTALHYKPDHAEAHKNLKYCYELIKKMK